MEAWMSEKPIRMLSKKDIAFIENKYLERSYEKTIKRIVTILLVLLIAICTGFGIYVSKYYRADEDAATILDKGLADGSIVNAAEWLELDVLDDTDNDVGIIFYPGGKVEYIAYLPILDQLYVQGIHCYLADMPFNLAMFGVNRADDIMAANANVEHWYMAGHSLGGAFASSYASKHPGDIDGVILLGAYLYGDYPEAQSITIYGSNDEVLNRKKITYDNNVHEIVGGNHAQFGNYGAQKGDGTASISADEQQRQAVKLILEFVK